GRIFGLQADRRARQTYLRQAGAEDALAGDEGGAAGRARLFAVRVGKADAFVGDAIDVGRAIAHHAAAVAAQVPNAEIVAPNPADVGLLGFRHVCVSGACDPSTPGIKADDARALLDQSPAMPACG